MRRLANRRDPEFNPAYAGGETNIPTVSQLNKGLPTMGDRSPKSVQKKASQKQAAADVVNKKKQSVVNDQLAAKAKQAANKKK